MITDRRLTARLERTLAAKADQATGPDTSAAERSGFLMPDGSEADEVATPVVDLHPTHRTPGDDRANGRRRWRVAAAAAAAVAALVGGLVALPGDDDPESDDTTATFTGPPTDGWLVPGWVPEGAIAWGIDTTTYDPRDAFPGSFAQLFGDPVAGPVMYLSSPDNKEIAPDSAHDVTVRGQTGSAGTGWGVAEEDLGPAITWEERGVEITALYRGMTEDEAVDALDALEWSSDIPAEGFVPTDDRLPLRGEGPASPGTSHELSLHYDLGEPDGEGSPDLLVSTSTSNVPGAYLETWYLAGTGDGTTPVSTRTGGDHVTVWTIWPNGRSVSVSADTAAAPSLTPDVLERVADSVAEAADGDVDALRGLVSARVAALPVLASADTTIGTVEVHGTGGFMRLCRPASEAAASCATSGFTGGGAPDGSVPTTTASWTVDGAWFVAVASQGEPPLIVGSTDASSAPDAGELPAETTTAGDWTVRLVEVPASLESVCTGTEAAMACTQQRPD